MSPEGQFLVSPNNTLLFKGFPCDATVWRRVRLARPDFGLLRYCRRAAEDFAHLSKGTLRVVDAAANFGRIETESSVNIRAVVAALGAGAEYPALIAVDSGEGDLVLVEGYTRATAHAVLGTPKDVDFIIGTSPDIRRWYFY